MSFHEEYPNIGNSSARRAVKGPTYPKGCRLQGPEGEERGTVLASPMFISGGGTVQRPIVDFRNEQIL